MYIYIYMLYSNIQAALKSVHDKHVQALQELRAAQADHASIPERLHYLEQAYIYIYIYI